MKIIVTGSRDHQKPSTVRTALTAMNILASAMGTEFKVVVGDCPTGVDKFVRDWCKQYLESTEDIKVYTADWDKLGKAAGPKRNRAMVAENTDAELILAFYWRVARNVGTRNCVVVARNFKLKVIEFR